MMYTKPKPVGVDIPIQFIQNHLHTELLALWNLNTNDWECYGRAYRNVSTTGMVPQVFAGGINYISPLTNDNKVLTSFFGGPYSTRIKLGQSTGQVHLVFCINLDKVRPEKYATIAHRTDEEIHQDVLTVLKGQYMGEVSGLEVGADNSLREYMGTRTEKQRARDLQPFHIFRVNLELKYDNTNC